MGYTQAEILPMFLTLFVIILLGVILRFTLKKAPLKVRQIPLHILGATIVIIEIVKQIYRIAEGTWTLRCLPFHFCSFFLVWYGLALITHGKFRQLMYFCSLVGGITVTVVMYCAPRIILVDAARIFWDNFGHFHAFFFHMSVVAYWVWMLMLNVYQPERQHIRKAVMLYTAFFFVTIAAAFIFHENFADVLYPSIKAFDQFRLTAGQFAYDVGLLAVGIGVITGVSFAVYYGTSKLYRHNLKQTEKLHVEQN